MPKISTQLYSSLCSSFLSFEGKNTQTTTSSATSSINRADEAFQNMCLKEDTKTAVI